MREVVGGRWARRGESVLFALLVSAAQVAFLIVCFPYFCASGLHARQKEHGSQRRLFQVRPGGPHLARLPEPRGAALVLQLRPDRPHQPRVHCAGQARCAPASRVPQVRPGGPHRARLHVRCGHPRVPQLRPAGPPCPRVPDCASAVRLRRRLRRWPWRRPRRLRRSRWTRRVQQRPTHVLQVQPGGPHLARLPQPVISSNG